MTLHKCKVLVLDQAGLPKEWTDQRTAIIYHATQKVGWQLGENEANIIFRGGTNRVSGQVSQLQTSPIIALRNDNIGSIRMAKIPTLNNKVLFRRDNNTCAYCGQEYKDHQLTRDHIVPTSRKGPNIWINVITACKGCNNYKDNRLLSEIDLVMRFQPYIPNHAEALLYENPHVLSCQMEYLLSFVPSKSRAYEYVKRFEK